MPHRLRTALGGLTTGLLGLGACQTPETPERPPRLVPLLETMAPRYRPILNRQDTLESFWAPDSLYTDILFQLSNAHRSQVLLRVQFVPASVAAAARLDTLTFRRTYLRLEEYEQPGYHWDFFAEASTEPKVAETADGTPLRMSITYSWRLALLEHRRWPAGNTYERNSYLMDYPFGPVAEARVSDSVVYVRAYPLRPDRPRPDTLYTYFQHGKRRKRIPVVADQLDTTRQALLRLSFRVLSHSDN
ncbi:hypothetical protein [Hymenobacter sp. BT559]|uniref:hypothetical protein n=1 Tax=Hymenobacter sp. BT559 TaxID=2795729 RepID=UPI0018EB9955|nr:hypothetical protein [Hymenobacter sp. BT559]MBJ6143458.1 hypothetical protein [Hymenobacter sp. BT559]